MNLIFHFPTSEADQKELARRMAAAHAEAVKAQLQALPVPVERKLQLLRSIRCESQAQKK